MRRILNLAAVKQATAHTLTAGLELLIDEDHEEAGHEAGAAFDLLAGVLLDSESLTAESYHAAVQGAYQTVANLIRLHEVLPLPDTAYHGLVTALAALQEC